MQTTVQSTALVRTVGKQQTRLMARASSELNGVGQELRVKIKTLDDEIRADQRSKAEHERQLNLLTQTKEALEARIRQHREFIEQYDKDIGPFTNGYEGVAREIGTLYENAKVGHSRGVELLKKEFGYFPSYKRPGDSFSAVPFRPK